MGYYGDIAFAIVTQDTGGVDGGPVDGPLIARSSSARCHPPADRFVGAVASRPLESPAART